MNLSHAFGKQHGLQSSGEYIRLPRTSTNTNGMVLRVGLFSAECDRPSIRPDRIAAFNPIYAKRGTGPFYAP